MAPSRLITGGSATRSLSHRRLAEPLPVMSGTIGLPRPAVSLMTYTVRMFRPTREAPFHGVQFGTRDKGNKASRAHIAPRIAISPAVTMTKITALAANAPAICRQPSSISVFTDVASPSAAMANKRPQADAASASAFSGA